VAHRSSDHKYRQGNHSPPRHPPSVQHLEQPSHAYAFKRFRLVREHHRGAMFQAMLIDAFA
jgi:hypothetical protein